MIADKGLTLYAITLGTFANASSNVTVPEAASAALLAAKALSFISGSVIIDTGVSQSKVFLRSIPSTLTTVGIAI